MHVLVDARYRGCQKGGQRGKENTTPREKKTERWTRNRRDTASKDDPQNSQGGSEGKDPESQKSGLV